MVFLHYVLVLAPSSLLWKDSQQHNITHVSLVYFFRRFVCSCMLKYSSQTVSKLEIPVAKLKLKYLATLLSISYLSKSHICPATDGNEWPLIWKQYSFLFFSSIYLNENELLISFNKFKKFRFVFRLWLG